MYTFLNFELSHARDPEMMDIDFFRNESMSAVCLLILSKQSSEPVLAVGSNNLGW